MSFVTVKKAIALGIEDLKKQGKDQSLGVIFFGGEPLLKRDLIVQTLEHCRELEDKTGQLFHFKATTNGTLLDEEFLTGELTKEVFIALSLDGIEAAHNAHRIDTAGRGSFEKVSAKADMLLKHKPYAPVMAVVNPDTVQYFAESVKFLYSKGFRYLITTLNYAGDWNESHIKQLKKQYELLGDWYIEETIKEAKFYFSPFEVKIASHVHPGSCKKDRCELGQTQISVGPDGRLYPCVQFVEADPIYCIGDVDSGINEEARAHLFTLNGEEKESCQECAIRERCNHYCGCLNLQATGRIDTVSPVQCAHERTVLPIADKVAEKLWKKRNAMFIQKHYNEMFPLISLVEDRTGGTQS